MRRTLRRDLCQNCGRKPATFTLVWHWEAGVDFGIESTHDDEEDWCSACAARACGPITSKTPLPTPPAQET